MIGTTGGALLLIATIVFAGVLGIGAGGILCAVLRRPWNLKIVGIDAVLASTVAIIAAFILAEIEVSRGVWGSVVGPVWAIAVFSVIARHLLRRFSQ